MRVRMGWSGETSPNIWQKIDVELEQEDLVRVIRENDLPDDLHERLPTKICFALLQNEAEQLLLNKMISVGYPQDKGYARCSALTAASGEIVRSIKDKLA